VDRNFGISNGRILPSVIKVAKRYTYHEAVEAMEAGDADLSLLHAISATYESDRIAQGAMKVSKKEVLIYPKSDGSFELHEIDEDDLARSMIGEFMVLANSLLANFAVKNRIPMAFRGQEQPEPDFNSTSKLPPEGPAYLQATSPIRRYVDLLHERQILNFLRHGVPLYSTEDLERILNEIEPALITANQVSKETRRFYLLKYLQWLNNTQGAKAALSGTVVRLDGRTPLIELDTLYTTVFGRLRPDTKIGDHVQLKIVQIDPEQDYLKLEQV
jgi:exoribonuclease-2